ncbi:uncharacterized protein LOC110621919 [Manihot esculenta]|uniref:Uncharacterized protein n=2 Tax=Manihot esculenta TaxID=3983 RepID=A0ACB7H6M0_MANES|nr:uncharacterized protein LOC110621919 [Manihot esculenta]KAG8647694.1 hypothetical protein MANES_09G098200v8 [Manihot esculenta]
MAQILLVSFMAQILLVSFILLADAFVGLAMANVSDPPAPSPSISYRESQQPPLPRKLGNHQVVAPSRSPASAPDSGKELRSNTKKSSSEPENEEDVSIKGEEIKLLHERHHHSFDKSVAGGGVILGGLATTFLVAVFCYIKATGRHKAEVVVV